MSTLAVDLQTAAVEQEEYQLMAKASEKACRKAMEDLEALQSDLGLSEADLAAEEADMAAEKQATMEDVTSEEADIAERTVPRLAWPTGKAAVKHFMKIARARRMAKLGAETEKDLRSKLKDVQLWARQHKNKLRRQMNKRIRLVMKEADDMIKQIEAEVKAAAIPIDKTVMQMKSNHEMATAYKTRVTAILRLTT